MLLIDENRLQNQTIELIGLNYGLKQDKRKEDYFDYLDRIVDTLQYEIKDWSGLQGGE